MEIKTLKEREKEHLQVVLRKTGWDLEKAARLLQIPLSQVKRKIEMHGIKRPAAQRSSLEKPQESKTKEGRT